MSTDGTPDPMTPEEEPPRGSTPAVNPMNDRGGRVDIEDRPGKSRVDEAAEESFPASDAPSHTPPGYVDLPPPIRKG